MRNLIFALCLLGCPGCLDDRTAALLASSQAQDTTYPVYCADKHTYQEARNLGLPTRAEVAALAAMKGVSVPDMDRLYGIHGNDGCTSNGPPAQPIGTVGLPSGVPYPGDKAEGYVCDACAEINRLQQEAADAVDMAEPPKVAPPPAPVVACLMLPPDLWCVSRDDAGALAAWRLTDGRMAQQPEIPADWPTR